MKTRDQKVTAIVDIVNWYIARYPARKQQLLSMVDIYANLEHDIDIQVAYDSLEDTCQRICNPSDYINPPITDCGADYL